MTSDAPQPLNSTYGVELSPPLRSSCRRGSLWLQTIALLVLLPIPIGLRNMEIAFAQLIAIGLLLCVAVKWTSRSRTGVMCIMALFLLNILGTLIASSRYSEFSSFQFFRGIVFPLILVMLLTVELKDKLLALIGTYIKPMLVLAMCSIAFFFVFHIGIFNSTLDMPYDLLDNPRAYVFPTYFFHLIFVHFVFVTSLWQFPCLIVLLATGSKVTLAFLVLVYFCYAFTRRTFRTFVLVAFGCAFLTLLSWQFGVFDRVTVLLEDGDPWRIYEPLAALIQLSDPLTFAVGFGSGVPYWEGRETIVELEDAARLIENSRYDVHNGLITVFLRFGVLAGVLYLLTIFRAVKTSSPMERLALYLAILLFVGTSHGPVQTAEAIGLALGLRYLAFANSTKKKAVQTNRRKRDWRALVLAVRRA